MRPTSGTNAAPSSERAPLHAGPITGAQRTLWRLLEIYHALVYFADERADVYRRVGFKGGWMAYFATRSAPLGAADPSVVTACFYGFAESMVRRALPDAWQYATPAEATAARYEVFDQAARRLLGGHALAATTNDLATRLITVVESLPPNGRPLFAAHKTTPPPDEPHLRLFWAASALREYRGDAHIAALQTADLSPAASNRLMEAMRLVPGDQRTFRGWSKDEWAEATSDLQHNGWLDTNGEVTREGRERRARVEEHTDAASGPAWRDMAHDEVEHLNRSLSPLVSALVTAGAVPYPNGMGVAPSAELAAHR